jgi:hypothetical protein
MFDPILEQTGLARQPVSATRELIEQATIKLLKYCARNQWSGYDPYDGLNSPILDGLLHSRHKWARLMVIQLVKRSPWNCRPLLRIPKSLNPKALALFVSALLKLADAGMVQARSTIIALLLQLERLRSPRYPQFCWGYNFHWQARDFLAPQGTPNIICTTFAGSAFLDAFEHFHENDYLDIAVQAGYFLLNGLQITTNREGICFSYTPRDREQVHNANLLAAAFLARLYHLCREELFLKYARAAARFSLSRQAADGSWPYGEGRSQAWIDNFHTGYNLVALRRLRQYVGDNGLTAGIARGFNYYRRHFFTATGIPQYYHDRLYPIDIHAIAQSLITLIEFNDDENHLDLALVIGRWAIVNMQSPEGFFYYRQGKLLKNKISYMRWSQAWMLYALAHFPEV